ncbi:MAG TPA: hypothetical protein PLF61_05470 [Candidatus Goldiibacteriota bacterium]|nr:hypothetical protein [Candidatus Goldiibacteriota bacterium]
MKKIFTFLLIALLFFNLNVIAAAKKTATKQYGYKGARGFGAGIVVGLASGLSLKSWIDKTSAIQIDANWNFDYGAFGVGVAYLMHNFDLITGVQDSKFPVYFGIKGWGAFSEDVDIGIQIPIGIVWIPRTAPIDVFFQIEPGLTIIPSTHGAHNAGIGIRYYF